MTVRFASFNVENLFARPRAFNLDTWAQGKTILDAYAEFNSLIALANYTPKRKARMIEFLLLLEVYRDDDGIVRRNRTTSPRWAWLRANRRTFDVEREDTGIEILANTSLDRCEPELGNLRVESEPRLTSEWEWVPRPALG
jgi:hypothetical protein